MCVCVCVCVWDHVEESVKGSVGSCETICM